MRRPRGTWLRFTRRTTNKLWNGWPGTLTAPVPSSRYAPAWGAARTVHASNLTRRAIWPPVKADSRTGRHFSNRLAGTLPRRDRVQGTELAPRSSAGCHSAQAGQITLDLSLPPQLLDVVRISHRRF